MAAPVENELPEDFLDLLLAVFDDDALVHYLWPNDPKESTYDPTWQKCHFDDFTDIQCKQFFRFHKDDMVDLGAALNLPATIELSNRIKINHMDALSMTLRRLSYPCRLVDLERFFGWPKTTISMVVNYVTEHIYEHFSHKITDLNQDWLVNRMPYYAERIHAKGAPLVNCFGFIDGTVRPICRPVNFQRIVYNGHKRVHALKFQSISTPDGLIVNLFGPIEGRRHDSALLRLSGILNQFDQGAWQDEDRRPYCVYGDPAYPIRNYLLSPYRGDITADQAEFNRRMSSVRESVEWQFGKILQQFAFLDFKKNLKVFLQPVAKYYLVGGILTNCHTCLYGSESGSYFACDAPTLEQYLN